MDVGHEQGTLRGPKSQGQDQQQATQGGAGPPLGVPRRYRAPAHAAVHPSVANMHAEPHDDENKVYMPE
jgi:hypothetical protein